MRYAVIADIHGNLDALTEVIADIERKGGVDEVWSLGDIVGYGPEPHQCLELLRRCPHVGVAGNHDRAAVGKLDIAYFNPDAAIACQWTARQLAWDDKKYLENLPLTLKKGEITLVHGSLAEPLLEYIVTVSVAARSFAVLDTPFCLVGHSHVPAAFREEEGSVQPVPFSPGIGMVLGENRMIINPGGVGQPRDGDPRAAYAILDSESRIIRLYRIPYDFSATQDKMMRAGLPVSLITRLKAGR
jgi:predicted phosphodiesterase